MSSLFKLSNVNKSFSQGAEKLKVLRNINLEIGIGEAVALVGASGSGKTTLLQIAGLLSPADSGGVMLQGSEFANLSERDRTLVRSQALGFVYQFHHLLPEFTALENVVLPQLVAGKSKVDATAYAESLLSEFGLADRLSHRPSQLSGGEMQRVAIARALANDPVLLLADEPTGNLDDETSEVVFQLLMAAIKQRGMSALIATHNKNLALRMGRSVVLNKGELS
ncbi:MAG: ABC transporter ATP-binding protein [Rickettsiales bacterium]|nr:ABC transporter ATP-binding protein [Rickettsiales bacterium]